MKLEELVKDWGGFERLVADLHETGEVRVERDVKLTGQSGAPRQIDVVIRQKGALYDHLVLVECKYWKRKVRREQVDALATAVRDLRAAKGVIFSTKGFQPGAVTQAKLEGIEPYAIRELSKAEWGLPGQIVDLFLQFIQLGTVRASFPGARFLPRFAGAQPEPLALRYGSEGPESVTRLRNEVGEPNGKTLEQVLLDGANALVAKSIDQVGLFNGGAEGDFYVMCPGNLNFDVPLIFGTATGVVIVSACQIEVPVKIVQSRMTIDRADHLTFALAIENKVTGHVSTAARLRDSGRTQLDPVRKSEPDPRDPPLENGSVARVFLKGSFDASEIAGMTPVGIAEVSRPRR